MPQKPKAQRKEVPLTIRLSNQQKRLIKQASDYAVLDLSSWVRSTLVQAASKLVEERSHG